jgi:hypothetical protein
MESPFGSAQVTRDLELSVTITEQGGILNVSGNCPCETRSRKSLVVRKGFAAPVKDSGLPVQGCALCDHAYDWPRFKVER